MEDKKYYKNPVILIGAPRSGTKMLREILKFHHNIVGFLYEEERVWKYGNRNKLASNLDKSDVNDNIKNYIRNYFYKKARRNPGKLIVDKNVHNCLRLGFIREVFPESKIIHIVRDGRDVVCSVKQRWNSPLDLKYIIKSRSFPLQEIPFFIKRQVKFYYEKLIGGKNRAKWWGTRFNDSKEIVHNKSLLEVCGIQWKRCVAAVLDKKVDLDARQYCEVKYEDIIYNPIKEINKIFDFLDLFSTDKINADIREHINPYSVGRWKKELNREEVKLLLDHIGEYLQILGYIETESKSDG